MTAIRLNLLTDNLILTQPHGYVSLPGLLSRLAKDEVDSYPALRPHQGPAWHMFLVQLAAVALHRAGTQHIAEDEERWRQALRGLTPDFDQDEPWCLIVEDASKPAFLQPAVPEGSSVSDEVSTPDALDLLITSRNHDLKQSIANEAGAQDWLFALVSLQTTEGFGGQKNYGIARMNGGSSSRSMVSLAPLKLERDGTFALRLGLWFRRDVTALLMTRETTLDEHEHIPFSSSGGVALTWLPTWNIDEQLSLTELDIWFIEVCRRIRLEFRNDKIKARKGNSLKTRIAADGLKGSLADPWAPVHKVENKSFTLGEDDFTYKKIVDLLSGDWRLPLLAKLAESDSTEATMMLVTQALARGNCKTWGFKRVLKNSLFFAFGFVFMCREFA